MNNENKLLQSILLSGKEQADRIDDEAKAQAEKILSDAAEAAAASRAEIEAKAEADSIALVNSAKSNAALISRNAVLQAKRNEIEKTLNGISEYILALDDEKYFELLYKMASGLKGEKGEILLSEKDKSRLPADFESRMRAVGIDCTLSKDTADINGGFILKDGDIETSLAIDAVIEEKRNELEDFINLSLFKED